MIKLVEVKKTNACNLSERASALRYELGEIWINPSTILQIKPDVAMEGNLHRGYLPSDLDARQQFSRVHLGAGTSVSVVTVVGPPSTVAEKIFQSTSDRQLLKG